MTAAELGADRLLVAEMGGLLNDAEHYTGPGSDGDSRLTYLDRRPLCCTGSSTPELRDDVSVSCCGPEHEARVFAAACRRVP
ncbi:hypothetical protein ACFQ6B_31595 [Streptomyces wedmorensis]|uniref:Uncharacterized protein n=1 Tax=Streptomyces wedmorensis TaxID=43759 RepID=A0ABW6J7E1_STRWE